jgi:hypothetical protein
MRLASAPTSEAGLERELKFVLPEARGTGALALLRALCRPDQKYPSTVVSTIYYDTPALQLLGEKLDSDYLKLKVRLRWYGLSGARTGSTGSFLEVKKRVGGLRDKARVETPLQAAWLDDVSLADPALVGVLELAAPLGIPLPMPLMPVLMLRYSRYRFLEPVSRTRVSLDLDIAGVRGPRGLIHGGTIPAAVLEIKGGADDLPRALRPLAHLGARRMSFSKYGTAARMFL